MGLCTVCRVQALLDGLRLRADACAEGLASEVRIREAGALSVSRRSKSIMELGVSCGALPCLDKEATQRLESLLQQTRRDLEAKLESVRGEWDILFLLPGHMPCFSQACSQIQVLWKSSSGAP